MKSSSAIERNQGIDCLRCFLMYLIVVHHVSLYSQLGTYGLVVLAFLISVPAVDGFIGISGWYGIRFHWRKVWSIFGQIVYYAILNSMLAYLFFRIGWMSNYHIGIGNAWYGICYLALLFLSPFINAGVDGVIKTGNKLSVVGLLFIPFVIDYLSRCIGLGFSIGGFGSHTFVTMFYVYIFVRLYHVLEWNVRRSILSVVFIAYITLFSLLYLTNPTKTFMEVVTPWGWYNCPLVVVSSMFFIELFLRAHPPKWLERVCVFMVPSVFSVYLIHEVSSLGKEFLVGRMISSVVNSLGTVNGFGAVVCCLVLSLLVFILACMLDLGLRRMPLFLLKKVIGR